MPINFRLVGAEIRYIVDNCEAEAIIVQDDLVDRVEAIRAELRIRREPLHPLRRHRRAPPGTAPTRTLIAGAAASEPDVAVRPDDTWAFIYTSGTTGRPKGAIRSHDGIALHALVTRLDSGFDRDDIGLLVMPMCHANSLFFAFAFAYCGASVAASTTARASSPSSSWRRSPASGSPSPRWCRRTTS